MTRSYYRTEVVCEILELPQAQLRRYVRLGLIAPSGHPEGSGAAPLFTEEDLRRLRRIRRLQRDLGLNMAGLEVAMRLRDQIDDLQRQLAEFRRYPGRQD